MAVPVGRFPCNRLPVTPWAVVRPHRSMGVGRVPGCYPFIGPELVPVTPLRLTFDFGHPLTDTTPNCSCFLRKPDCRAQADAVRIRSKGRRFGCGRKLRTNPRIISKSLKWLDQNWLTPALTTP